MACPKPPGESQQEQAKGQNKVAGAAFLAAVAFSELEDKWEG